MCDVGVGVKSQDAFAFVAPLDPNVLGRLNFAPNTLGAEQIMHCALEMGGYNVKNPCDDLVIYHNHCSDYRTYGKNDLFMDAKETSWCPAHKRMRAWKGVKVVPLASICPGPQT